LELGCGSSNLAEKMTTLQHEVTCLDFSKEIIKSRAKSNSNSKITYKLHNIQEKLPYEDESFDVIIEKNTIDCLFCQ
jgi:2-polyprenyl-3-methyl-5-hydroxy-6-metoxy-1,4-benzoquinol methylase